MTWETFIYFAIPSVILWAAGAYFAFRDKRKLALTLTITGILVFAAYIAGIWISLERPPLRTMGETRLWYSFFLPVAGLMTYLRWKYKWILSFSTILAFVFILINIFKPEIHNKTLMPALQSPWFAPHVIIYMFSYAVLGAATVIGLYFLIRKNDKSISESVMHLIDNLGICGNCFSHHRHADWSGLGQRCLGTLLELGSERDVGSRHLAGLSYLHTLSES